MVGPIQNRPGASERSPTPGAQDRIENNNPQPEQPPQQDRFVQANGGQVGTIQVPFLGRIRDPRIATTLNVDTIQQEINLLTPQNRESRLRTLEERFILNQPLTNKEFIEYLILNNKSELAKEVSDYYKNRQEQIPNELQRIIRSLIPNSQTDNENLIQFYERQIQNGDLSERSGTAHQWIEYFLLTRNFEAAFEAATLAFNPNPVNRNYREGIFEGRSNFFGVVTVPLVYQRFSQYRTNPEHARLARLYLRASGIIPNEPLSQAELYDLRTALDRYNDQITQRRTAEAQNQRLREQLENIRQRLDRGDLLSNNELRLYAQHSAIDDELKTIINKYLAREENPSAPALNEREQARFTAWRAFPQDRREDILLRASMERRLLGFRSDAIPEVDRNRIDLRRLEITPREEERLLSAIETRIVARITRLIADGATPANNRILRELNAILEAYRRAYLGNLDRNIQALRDNEYREQTSESIRELNNRFGLNIRFGNREETQNSIREGIETLLRRHIDARIRLTTDPQERERIRLINALGTERANFILYTYPIRLQRMRDEINHRMRLYEEQITQLEETRRSSTNRSNIAQEEERLRNEYDAINRRVREYRSMLESGTIPGGTAGNIENIRIDMSWLDFNSNLNNSGYEGYFPSNNPTTNNPERTLFNELTRQNPALTREEKLRVLTLIRSLRNLPLPVLNSLNGTPDPNLGSINIPRNLISSDPNYTNHDGVVRFIRSVINNPNWLRVAQSRILEAVETHTGFLQILNNSPGRSDFSAISPLAVAWVMHRINDSIPNNPTSISQELTQYRGLKSDIRNINFFRRHYNDLIREDFGAESRRPSDPNLPTLIREIYDRFKQGNNDARVRRIFAIIKTLEGIEPNRLNIIFGVNRIDVPNLLRDLLNNNRNNKIAELILNSIDHANWIQRTTDGINERLRIQDLFLRSRQLNNISGLPNGTIIPMDIIRENDSGSTQRLIDELSRHSTQLESLRQRLIGRSFTDIISDLGLSSTSQREITQEVIRRYGRANLTHIYSNLTAYNVLACFPRISSRVIPPQHNLRNVAGAIAQASVNPLVAAGFALEASNNNLQIDEGTIIAQLVNGNLESSENGFLRNNNLLEGVERVIREETARRTTVQQEITRRTTELLGRERELARLIRGGVTDLTRFIGNVFGIREADRREIEQIIQREFGTSFSNLPAAIRLSIIINYCREKGNEQEQRERELVNELRIFEENLRPLRTQLAEIDQNISSANLVRDVYHATTYQQEGDTTRLRSKLTEMYRRYGSLLIYLAPNVWEMIVAPNGVLDDLIRTGEADPSVRDVFNRDSSLRLNGAYRQLLSRPNFTPNTLVQEAAFQTYETNPDLINLAQAVTQTSRDLQQIVTIVNARLGGHGSNPNNPNENTAAGVVYRAPVQFVRDIAQRIENRIDELHNNGTILNVRTRLRELQELRRSYGTNTNPVTQRLDRSIAQYSQFLGFVENRNLDEFLNSVRDNSHFNDSTLATWWSNHGARLISSIAAAALAITLTVLTLGAASPLLVFAVTAVAGVGGGIIGDEAGREINYAIERGRGNIYWTDRADYNRIGERVYRPDPQTGIHGRMHTITAQEVIARYGQRFARDLAFTVITLGAARGVSAPINNVLGRLISTQAGRQTVSSLANSLRAIETMGSSRLRQQVMQFLGRYSHELLNQSGMVLRTEPLRMTIDELFRLGEWSGHIAMFLDMTRIMLTRRGRRASGVSELGGGLRFNPNNRNRPFTYDPAHPEFSQLRQLLIERGYVVRPNGNGTLTLWRPGTRELVLERVATPTEPPIIPRNSSQSINYEREISTLRENLTRQGYEFREVNGQLTITQRGTTPLQVPRGTTPRQLYETLLFLSLTSPATRRPEFSFDSTVNLNRTPNPTTRVSPLESYVDFVNRGLELVRQGRYEDAINHFSSNSARDTIREAGLNPSFTRIVNIHETSQESLNNVLRSMIPQLFESTSNGTIRTPRIQFDPNMPANLRNQALRELALLYAEEHSHSLQRITERPISNRGQRNTNINHELDIAEFFRDRGIDLNNTIWVTRYGRNNTSRTENPNSRTGQNRAPFDDWFTFDTEPTRTRINLDQLPQIQTLAAAQRMGVVEAYSTNRLPAGVNAVAIVQVWPSGRRVTRLYIRENLIADLRNPSSTNPARQAAEARIREEITHATQRMLDPVRPDGTIMPRAEYLAWRAFFEMTAQAASAPTRQERRQIGRTLTEIRREIREGRFQEAIDIAIRSGRITSNPSNANNHISRFTRDYAANTNPARRRLLQTNYNSGEPTPLALLGREISQNNVLMELLITQNNTRLFDLIVAMESNRGFSEAARRSGLPGAVARRELIQFLEANGQAALNTRFQELVPTSNSLTPNTIPTIRELASAALNHTRLGGSLEVTTNNDHARIAQILWGLETGLTLNEAANRSVGIISGLGGSGITASQARTLLTEFFRSNRANPYANALERLAPEWSNRTEIPIFASPTASPDGRVLRMGSRIGEIEIRVNNDTGQTLIEVAGGTPNRGIHNTHLQEALRNMNSGMPLIGRTGVPTIPERQIKIEITIGSRSLVCIHGRTSDRIYGIYDTSTGVLTWTGHAPNHAAWSRVIRDFR